MKKIVLTGGGTAGHVTPNIALMHELRKRGYDISYIGSYEGMEKGMIIVTGKPYYGIATGKLRRSIRKRDARSQGRLRRRHGGDIDTLLPETCLRERAGTFFCPAA